MKSPEEYGLCSNLKNSKIDRLNSWYWMIMLSNGTHIYQDDSNGSAWIKLGLFLKDNQTIGIQRFGVYFRSNSYFLPDEQLGYYFAKGVLQGVGAAQKMDYYIMGYCDSRHNSYDPVYFQWIKVPELLPIKRFVKPIVECPSPMMINNPFGLQWYIPNI
jgi:hypothetical protein